MTTDTLDKLNQIAADLYGEPQTPLHAYRDLALAMREVERAYNVRNPVPFREATLRVAAAAIEMIGTEG